MITFKGHVQSLMLSLFKKEPAYNDAITVNNTNFCTVVGHTDFNPDFADQVQNDKGVVTGTEYGTDQYLLERGFKFTYSTPNVTPNVMIGLMALTEGSIATTKDGANDAYTHVIEEVAVGTATPSINCIGKKADKQYLTKGIKGGGYEIKIEEKKPVAFSCDLMGSGYRLANADAFVAKISESWILSNYTTFKMATGADISIDAVLTQGTQNISASTPTTLSSAIKSMSFKRNMNNTDQRMGSTTGDAVDIDFGTRGLECSINMRYADYITLYENQTTIAIEADCKQGAKIDADGSLYFGFKLVICRAKLKKFPFPEGGVNDETVCTFELDIQDDGTNPPFKFAGFNAVAAYLA